VRSGDWNPEQSDESKKHLDAIEAKGYWDAVQQVMTVVERVLHGENCGEVFESVHGDWYLVLFGSSVAAGIVEDNWTPLHLKA
jgi:hypothetical protein